jgi:hypothetical protein
MVPKVGSQFSLPFPDCARPYALLVQPSTQVEAIVRITTGTLKCSVLVG